MTSTFTKMYVNMPSRRKSANGFYGIVHCEKRFQKHALTMYDCFHHLGVDEGHKRVKR